MYTVHSALCVCLSCIVQKCGWGCFLLCSEWSFGSAGTLMVLSVLLHLDLSSRSAAGMWGMSVMWRRPSELFCWPSLGRKPGILYLFQLCVHVCLWKRNNALVSVLMRFKNPQENMKTRVKCVFVYLNSCTIFCGFCVVGARGIFLTCTLSPHHSVWMLQSHTTCLCGGPEAFIDINHWILLIKGDLFLQI